MKSVRVRSFSGSNTGKCGPEKLRTRTPFTQRLFQKLNYIYKPQNWYFFIFLVLKQTTKKKLVLQAFGIYEVGRNDAQRTFQELPTLGKRAYECPEIYIIFKIFSIFIGSIPQLLRKLNAGEHYRAITQ